MNSIFGDKEETRSGTLWLTGRRLGLLLVPLAILFAATVPVDADGGGRRIKEQMTRVGPEVASPSGHSVAIDCQAPGPMDPEGWANGRALLRIRQSDGKSQVVITIRKVRPHTFYTVWLRLGGTDSNGDSFGGNPVTGGRATPLAATSDLSSLLEATGPGNGTDQVVNGFWTNAAGNATFRRQLDFPIVAGAYPFQRFPDWDPTDPRLPAENPAIYPVAIAGPQGPFTLRVVSHCTDEVGHGLGSGPRELWFDWTVAS